MDVETIAKVIPYLLSKPNEWLVSGRGNFNFNLPREYLPDAYKDNPDKLYARFPYLKNNGRVDIKVKALEVPIDFTGFNMVGVDETFSVFVAHHQKAASVLIHTLLGQKSVEDFFSACVCVRDRVNPSMFAYALTIALNNHPEKALTRIKLPSFVSIFPQYFLPSSVIDNARAQLIDYDKDIRTPIEVEMQFTATDLELEQRVAYFREDIALNSHHHYWHLVYPHDDASYKPTSTQLPSCIKEGETKTIVNKDRRGELFYYMHQQMIARYNFERLSNRMARVRPLKDLQEPIVEGYFPKLVNKETGKAWPSRQPNSVIKSVTRELEQIVVNVDHTKRLTDRILSAIDSGSARSSEFEVELDKEGKPVPTSRYKYKRVPLEELKGNGIDILSNMIESNCLSINRDYYGDMHNMGHILLALIHDPDGRFKEGLSMMGTNVTTCRDPVFWRWHAHINDLFTAHKNKLEPYTKEYLQFDGIKVTEVNVNVDGCVETNVFRTFWRKDIIDISWGIDHAKGEDDGPSNVSVPHLDHKPFTYSIKYHNLGEVRDGTVRIFMAPKYDESLEEYIFFHQRGLFIELDRFVEELKPGENVIKRSSKDSSVTIPWDQTVRSIGHVDQTTDKQSKISEKKSGDQETYCGCGWPAHLLIPRGSGEGLDVDLFVMITDTKEDKAAEFHGSGAICRDAMSYCGLIDSLYPDKKPMGFPFDRRPRTKPGSTNAPKLKDFLTDNMCTQNVKIRFTKEEPITGLQPWEMWDSVIRRELKEVLTKIKSPGTSAEGTTSKTLSQKEEIKKIFDELINAEAPPEAAAPVAPPKTPAPGAPSKAAAPEAPPKAAASETPANGATSEPPSKSATKSAALGGTTTGSEKLPMNTSQVANGKTQQG